MATPRKHWFRVADSVALEPWSNDVAATFMRLLAHMNTRWAREGLSPEDACRVLIPARTLMTLTGSQDARTAQRRIQKLATTVTIRCKFIETMRGAGGKACSLEWPKYAEFQGLTARESPESSPRVAPSASAPARRKTQDALV